MVDQNIEYNADENSDVSLAQSNKHDQYIESKSDLEESDDDQSSSSDSSHSTNKKKRKKSKEQLIIENSIGTPDPIFRLIESLYYGNQETTYFDPFPLVTVESKIVCFKSFVWTAGLGDNSYIYCNPPYSLNNNLIRETIGKINQEIKDFKSTDTRNSLRIILLIPVSKAKYFKSIWENFKSISFLPGVAFLDHKGNEFQKEFQNPLCLVEFSSEKKEEDLKFEMRDYNGQKGTVAFFKR